MTRCEIVIADHKDDYAAAMGELNVRRYHLEKRLTDPWYQEPREKNHILKELVEINGLLFDYRQSLGTKTIDESKLK